MPRWVALLAAVGLAAALALVTVPWATKSRTALTGTPTPPPFSVAAPLSLGPGSRVCQSEVALETITRAAVLVAWKAPPPGPPLRVTVKGPGYDAVSEVPGGYKGIGALTAPLPAPPRSLLATVCVENRGSTAVPLEATAEGRVTPRPVTLVDGHVAPQKVTLLLTQGPDRSLASRRGQVLDRVAAFKPWWIGRVSLVLLGLLVLGGVPLLVVAALLAAGRERQ